MPVRSFLALTATSFTATSAQMMRSLHARALILGTDCDELSGTMYHWCIPYPRTRAVFYRQQQQAGRQVPAVSGAVAGARSSSIITFAHVS
jgi:hypothetical protein